MSLLLKLGWETDFSCKEGSAVSAQRLHICGAKTLKDAGSAGLRDPYAQGRWLNAGVGASHSPAQENSFLVTDPSVP